MRIAHVADLHIGVRRYERTNPAGANQREHDTLVAFRRAVDGVLAAKVDALLIAGDVFDSVRPGNGAIIGLYGEMVRLSTSGVETVIIGGNHDTPRSLETVNVLTLFAKLPHVHVVVGKPGRVRLGDLSVACLPHVVGGMDDLTLAPDPDATWNVALAHLPYSPGMMLPWNAGDFHYNALGDYHVAQEVESGVWFSGSLEYVSTNPWGEMQDEAKRGYPGKGWLLVELRPDFPQVEFQSIATRKLIDLPVIDVGTRTPDDVALHMRANVQDVAIADAVVRQVLVNVPRGFQKLLDHEAVRSFKGQALHYHLDCRRLAGERKVVTAALVARAASLMDIVEDALNARPLSDNVDREGLKALARKYMGEAEEQAVPVRESLVA